MNGLICCISFIGCIG